MMTEEGAALLLLLFAWILFFLLHSLLAGHGVKKVILTKFPAITPCYRLLYNLFALISLIPVALIHAQVDSTLIWQWKGSAEIVVQLLRIAALIGFIWSLKYYDLGAFSGINSCLRKSTPKVEQLTISPLHRFVRHPWYSCAIILIWCRDQSGIDLLSSVMVSAYLFIGARLEEKRLMAEYGGVYREYMQLVPGIIPRPWQHIEKTRAEELMRLSADDLSASPPGRQDQ